MESLRLEAAQYLHECKQVISSLTVAKAQFYAAKATELIFTFHQATAQSLREAVELLCLLNASPQSEISRIGIEALFPNLIEKLNDSFQPDLCELYDQIFAQIISFYRQLPEGQLLDEKLNAFNLPDEAALLARRATLNRPNKYLAPTRKLKKILILSRVTIGADVAITSVLLSSLLQQFPEAEIVLLGSEKLSELYGGEPRIRVHKIQYGRGDSLLSRLLSWLDVVAVIGSEFNKLEDDAFCIVDPDSRLTQLGLLPVLPSHLEAANYFYFPSRRYQISGKENLSHLTSDWINEICRTDILHHPFLALTLPIKNIGTVITRKLRLDSSRPVIVLSFGVGGNAAKRINEDFEIQLTERLAESSRIILDKGISEFELSQVEKITNSFLLNDKKVLELTENNFQKILASDNWCGDIYTWQGGIGSFASIIQASDCYVGYDSSGQHFAAACNTPLITIFVNSGSDIFTQRWQPMGKTNSQILHVNSTLFPFNSEIVSTLIQKILSKYQQVFP